MKQKLSQAQIAALRESGARVSVASRAATSIPLNKETPANPPAPTVAEMAMAQMATNLSHSQKELLRHLEEVLAANHSKPTSFRFTITRNKKGLIESIDATPIG